MAANDDHIIKLVGRGKLKQIFVGIYGDETDDGNQMIRRKVEMLQGMRQARYPLEAHFFDAASAQVWGP